MTVYVSRQVFTTNNNISFCTFLDIICNIDQGGALSISGNSWFLSWNHRSFTIVVLWVIHADPFIVYATMLLFPKFVFMIHKVKIYVVSCCLKRHLIFLMKAQWIFVVKMTQKAVPGANRQDSVLSIHWIAQDVMKLIENPQVTLATTHQRPKWSFHSSAHAEAYMCLVHIAQFLTIMTVFFTTTHQVLLFLLYGAVTII